MTRNSVAANLLMAVLLLGGLFGMMRVKQEVFPEFELDVVTVSVPYPGASPEEVEQGIVLALEEAVLGVDGIKRITSSASEGVGTVSALLLLCGPSDRPGRREERGRPHPHLSWRPRIRASRC